MPFCLKEIEDFPELDGCKSVLIIPCRFCPAASLAVSRNEPYIELFRRFLKTASFEQFIKTMKSDLEKKGVKTDVFKSHLPHQFVLCGWTSKRRQKLLKHVKKYEALLVLGCEAAVQTIRDSVKSTSCQVFQGMKTMGIMSIKPSFKLPCNISLELDSLTPMVHLED
ncbi:MAG: hypothetical protein ACYS80_21625 [Planctomycetota bacterium]|jgi:hypothetical protein